MRERGNLKEFQVIYKRLKNVATDLKYKVQAYVFEIQHLVMQSKIEKALLKINKLNEMKLKIKNQSLKVLHAYCQFKKNQNSLSIKTWNNFTYEPKWAQLDDFSLLLLVEMEPFLSQINSLIYDYAKSRNFPIFAPKLKMAQAMRFYRQENMTKFKTYLEDSISISKKIGNSYLFAIAHWMLASAKFQEYPENIALKMLEGLQVDQPLNLFTFNQNHALELVNLMDSIGI